MVLFDDELSILALVDAVESKQDSGVSSRIRLLGLGDAVVVMSRLS